MNFLASKFPILRLLVLTAVLLAGCAPRSAIDPGRESVFSNYLFAVYASARGDQQIATRSYLKVLKEEPGNLRLMEEAFSYFLYVGDYRRAFKVGRELYRVDPANTPAAMLLAVEAFKSGRAGDMDKYLSQVRGFGFDNLMSPLMKAWIKAQEGDADGALEELEPLTGYKPFATFYDEHRALILDYAGRTAEAGASYARQVVRDEISSLQPVLNYGAFLQIQERSEEARALYARFLALLPGNKQLTDALARLEEGQKPVSIAQNPTKALAMAFLRTGVQVGRERALAPAIIYSRFAIYLDPSLDQAHIYLGGLMASEVTPSLALAAYSQVDPEGPYGEEAILRKALVLSSYEKWEQAIAVITAHLEENPESEDALATLGDLYRNREDFEGALKYYQRAIDLKGELAIEDWFVLFARGIAYERLGRWPEAEADFLKTLEFRPNEPDVLNYLGYSWIDQGINLIKGREMIERAAAQRPNNGFIVDSLGWAQYLMGDYQEAAKTLEKAVTLEPGDATLNDHLGDAYWKVGREREARFQWQHALGLNPAPDQAGKIAAKIEYGPVLAEALEARK